VIIDPHISLIEKYKQYLSSSNLALKYIVDTHTHADHFSGAAVLKKQFNTPILMGEKAISNIVDRRLKDNDQIELGSEKIKVIYSPGHTDDAVSLYGEGRLFSADVLLIGSVGRTDFQNGSPESMFDTLQKLKQLPDDTILCPGHDYNGKKESTIGHEKEHNPFLKETNKEAFVANLRSKVMPKPFNIDNIIRVNQRGEAAQIEMIKPADAAKILKTDPQAKVLDVRSAMEINQVHLNNILISRSMSLLSEWSSLAIKIKIILCFVIAETEQRWQRIC
jgi:hypothetical protein